MEKHDPTHQTLQPKTVDKLTTLDLLDAYFRDRDWAPESSSARSFKSHLKRWCDFLGHSLTCPAAISFSGNAVSRLSELTDTLVSEGYERSVKNVRWTVTEAQQLFNSLRVSDALPSDFHEAFRAAMASKDWWPYDVIKAINQRFYTKEAPWQGASSIYGYFDGKHLPAARFPNSRQLVARLEQVLDLPVDALASRAFKGPSIIQLGNSAPIAYREHQSKLAKSFYTLKEMPPQLASLWREIVAWRSQPTLRVRGELHIINKGKFWMRSSSSKKYENNLLRFMGWLTLPVPEKPIFELSEEDKWKAGKGISIDELTLRHWVDTDLLWEFFEFLRARQHNNELTNEHLHFLIFINSLVNHPYSFIKAHDKLSIIFETSLKGDAWVDFVEKNLHEPILKLARQMRKATSQERQRSPEEPLKTVFEDKDPFVLMMELVRRMEFNLSPKSFNHMYISQARDITLFRMCLEIPLRAQNLANLQLNKHLTRSEETGLWTLSVSKNELKNHNSPYAHDIYRAYSESTSQAIDRYLKDIRPMFKGAEKVDWFFLAATTGPKRKINLNSSEFPRQLTTSSIYWLVRSRTEQYFGVGMGSNIFRHLIATAILKDDPSQVETAAAVLNNAPDTIRENYKHLTQKDGLRAAAAWQEVQQDKFQKRFGNQPRS